MVKIIGVFLIEVVLTIKEMSYLVVSMFDDLVGAFVLLFVTLTFLPAFICFNSAIA